LLRQAIVAVPVPCRNEGIADEQLPAGWTLEEIRNVSGDREALRSSWPMPVKSYRTLL
jgi:hypothetical protein